jgi:hypothetical protein
MRARALFAATVAAVVLAVASPAAAKVGIAEVRISGPGLGGDGLRITGSATAGMWDSGIDWAGGLDDARAGSATELGIAATGLGPKYVVTYRLETGNKRAEIVRQELFPYAKGGPVTYTPSGQRIAGGLPWGAAITAGWHQTSSEFFRYLVDQGLPDSNPPGRRRSPACPDGAHRRADALGLDQPGACRAGDRLASDPAAASPCPRARRAHLPSLIGSAS